MIYLIGGGELVVKRCDLSMCCVQFNGWRGFLFSMLRLLQQLLGGSAITASGGYVMRPTDCMLSDTPIAIYARSNSGNKCELDGGYFLSSFEAAVVSGSGADEATPVLGIHYQ